MPNANFWLEVMDKNAGRFSIKEEWKDDTTKFIKDLKDKSPNKQTKTYLDGLLKHLGKEGFLSDEQKSSLAHLTTVSKKGGSSDTSSKSKDKPKTKEKDTSNDAKDTSDNTPKKKIKGETGKEIKKQLGSLLGKLGGVGKSMASKVDSKAVDAIDQGVAGGASVKDATASVLDKIKDDLLKKKEAKEVEKKKKSEAKKVKSAKKESFGYNFRNYLK